MKMKANRYFVWVLFSCITNTNENNCDGFIQLNNGRILDGIPFWESRTNDAIECARSCVKMKKCKSFNFDSKSGMCQVNEEVGKEVHWEGTVVHSDISNWPSQIDPSCYDRPCGMDEVCISGTQQGTSCSYSCFKLGPKKCPQPEGTMSSQSRTVGSVYIHTCGSGTVGGDSALCLPTGQWNKTIDTTCTPAITSYRYVGCYADCYSDGLVCEIPTARVMGQLLDDEHSMSEQTCFEHCLSFNMPYFGLEFGRECWCGDEGFRREGAVDRCNVPCTGNTSQICGGRSALSVYEYI